jgi:hypothetical protein
MNSNSPSQERSLEDCYYFLYSNCKRGPGCVYRHSLESKASTKLCNEWEKTKKCTVDCPFRHSFYHLQKKRSNDPCYFEETAQGCTKEYCEFKHKDTQRDSWKLEGNVEPSNLNNKTISYYQEFEMPTEHHSNTFPVSNQLNGFPLANQLNGFPNTNQSDKLPINNHQAYDLHHKNQSNVFPISNQSNAFPTISQAFDLNSMNQPIKQPVANSNQPNNSNVVKTNQSDSFKNNYPADNSKTHQSNGLGSKKQNENLPIDLSNPDQVFFENLKYENIQLIRENEDVLNEISEINQFLKKIQR